MGIVDTAQADKPMSLVLAAVIATALGACATASGSRPPVPPCCMNEALLRHYPSSARDEGIEGLVRVKIRVGQDASITPIEVLAQPDARLGEACSAMLKATPGWQPAQDASGNPIERTLTYRCMFELGQRRTPSN